eukprot:scaffold189022_cov27-Tisochrysis_lutea.AAC.1
MQLERASAVLQDVVRHSDTLALRFKDVSSKQTVPVENEFQPHFSSLMAHAAADSYALQHGRGRVLSAGLAIWLLDGGPNAGICGAMLAMAEPIHVPPALSQSTPQLSGREFAKLVAYFNVWRETHRERERERERERTSPVDPSYLLHWHTCCLHSEMVLNGLPFVLPGWSGLGPPFQRASQPVGAEPCALGCCARNVHIVSGLRQQVRDFQALLDRHPHSILIGGAFFRG